MSSLQKKKRESFRGIMATEAGSLADRNSEWGQMSRCFQEFVYLVTHSVVFSTKVCLWLNAFSFVAKPSRYVMLLHNFILQTKQSNYQPTTCTNQMSGFRWQVTTSGFVTQVQTGSKTNSFQWHTSNMEALQVANVCKSMKMCFKTSIN